MKADDPNDAIPFSDVLQAELRQIRQLRDGRLPNIKPGAFPTDQHLVGLALSGGGERSATFSLGVLQGLARFGLLRHVDYLSSTGGGAQIAGWLLRWIRARGFQEVESQLGGKGSPRIDAPEIQALRRSIALGNRKGFSVVILARPVNVILNFVALGALLAAVILLARLGLERLSSLPYAENVYPIAAVTTAILLFLLQIKKSRKCPPSQLHTVLIAGLLTIFAAVLVHEGMTTPWSHGLWQWLIVSGLAVSIFVLILGLQPPYSLKQIIVHVAGAIIAGALTIGLLKLLHLSLIALFPPTVNYQATDSMYDLRIYEWQMYLLMVQVAVSLVILFEVAALSIHALLTQKGASRGTHELFWRVCQTLLAFSFVLLIAASTWMLPGWATASGLLVALLLTFLGLLKGLGVQTQKSFLPRLLKLLESLAPFTFLLLLAGLAAAVLFLVIQQYAPIQPEQQMGIAGLLALLSFLLLWLIRARELTLHHVQRAQIVRNYLAPATTSAPTDAEGVDVKLDSFAAPAIAGPYPLFGAALNQPETVPFVFSPLFSGFELPGIRDPKQRASEAYRPTQMLAGGTSLATAIAVSQPIRSKSCQPPSGRLSLLWTILNMRDGRFMGNPVRNDTWLDQGPLIEPVYALRERDLPTEAPFVRPSPSEEFDYLGIYELVKRQCRFIIACDATHDPAFSFKHLGDSIRACRMRLGVDIQIDLGPLGRTPKSTGTHYLVAQIRYGNGVEGFMLYLKPSLTGDEPGDMDQYARDHPEFPSSDVAASRFEEANFDSYRVLGQHITDRVFAEMELKAEKSTEELLTVIREKLQPDYIEPEKTLPTPPPEVAKVLPSQELVAAIASRECVLCTGFGLAAQAKLPTWPALLDDLIRKAREDRILDSATVTGLQTTLAAGELEAAADELTHQVSRDLLVEHVRSVTGEAKPSDAHKYIAKMKFLGALNLSIDDLVATSYDAKALVPAQAELLVEALRSKTFFVANLFGTTSQPSSLLFTMKEFRHLLLANSQLKQFLATLFLRYTVIFVGLGMDGLRDFMEALELPQTPERKHYVVLANSGQIDPLRVRFLERTYNIRVIDYQPQYNYEGLPVFLDNLQEAVNENAPQPKASGPLTLKSVSLENIGPFHSLQVEFTPQWNLLLGNNGVGKTVLLKAIAAALCGDKADPEAVARLLRVGATKGSIRLKDEHREYTVELAKKDGFIQVVSASLSPIIYEKWLVLGFPALRSVPLNRPKGPRPGKSDVPSAEDLLPLLRGEPDNRVSDIKQWLVNLDYSIKKENALSSRSRKLWINFFRILRLLTPGLRFEPGTINDKTWEITVVTDSGVVPLELVSQGTGAVMCWIGTLLERLSETHRDSALILIDELDAHMHPKWQQLFVDAFRKEFKSVQIIATTHSPLLVGSLNPEEIKLVRRVPLTAEFYGVVNVEKIDDQMREVIVRSAEDAAEESVDSEEPKETPVEEPRVKRYRVPVATKLLVRDGQTVEKHQPITQDEFVVVDQLDIGHQGWRADQILASPLFQLEHTRDPQTAEIMTEYTRLNALDHPTKEDQGRLTELAGKLQIRLANPEETEAARLAFSIIEDSAKQRLAQMPPEQQRKVLNEVKVQLKESITGSGRRL